MFEEPMTHTDLALKMLALADGGHPRAAELREKAQAFDKATADRVDAKKLLGAWARARRCWSECSGEPLI
jgi:hypothetical protein